MGLVASQARLLMLNDRRMNLEFAMQQISQQKMMISQRTGALGMQEANMMQQGMGIDANDANQANQFKMAQGQMEAIKQVLFSQEKQLDSVMKIMETQYKAVCTEYESVQKIIDKNIEKSFKYVS